MAQHKAPTEVTVVAHEEQSALAGFVEKHWLKAAALAVVIAAGIMFNQYRNQQAAEELDASWSKLMGALEQDLQTGRLVGDPDSLAALVNELGGTDAGPWAIFLEAQSLRAESKHDEAITALTKLRDDYPEHPLVSERYRFGDDLTAMTLIDHMTKVYRAEGIWMAEHEDLYANPAPAPGSPKVRIKTDKGDIVVALYSDRAPLLSENFMKLSSEGFYDGTHVHRVVPGMIMEAGDPNSREGDGATWGNGGAEHTVEKEITGLSNFEGYLAMVVKPGEESPNGSLFYLTAGPVHFFNHRNVVFGKVVEGLDVVKTISEAATEAPSPRPLNPIAIIGTEVIPGA